MNISADAFTAFYEQYYTELYRYVLVRLRHEEATADIVQQVFFELWRNREKLKELHPTLLYVTAKRRILDYGRIMGRRDSWTFLDESSGTFDIEEPYSDPGEYVADRDASRRAIQAAFANLSPVQATAVWMWANGQRYDEIARCIQKSYASTKNNVHRGRVLFQAVYRQQQTV